MRLRKEVMTRRVKSTTRKTRSAIALVALVGAIITGALAVGSDAKTTNSAAARPTVYMVGSVANNTFWAAVKRGFEQGGKDFGLHAVYYTDKSILKSTVGALSAGIKVTLFNNNRFEAVGGKQNTATTDPRVTSLAYVGEDSLANAKKLATAFVPFIKKKGTVLIVDP